MMRQIFHTNKAIAALTAIALFSCQQPEEALISDDAGSFILTVTCRMPEWNPDSRTAWTGETIFWSAGDKIAMCLTEDGDWNDAVYVSEPLSEDSARAEYQVTLPSGLSGRLDFCSIYPYSAVKSDNAASAMTVEIPSEQTPAADSFDPAADLMVGKTGQPCDGLPVTSLQLHWTRLVAHADITLKSLPLGADETIRSVSLKVADGTALAGDFVIDMDTQELTSIDGSSSSEVLADAGNLTLTASGDLRLWFCVAPCTLTSFEVTVITDAATYVRAISSCTLPLLANTRNIFAIDMSGALVFDYPDEEKNALINPRLFDVIDLDVAGLEDAKSYYSKGYLYEAAAHIKEYYASRTSVINPSVTLTLSSNTSDDLEKADKALAENGYCFYVNGYEYYSFSDGAGSIDWEVTPVTENQFKIQKHRHQWVEPQARVYWVTKNEKYAKAIADVYADWLETYPCPVAGSSSYSISGSDRLYDMWTDLQATSRVLTYINTLYYCAGSEAFSPEFLSDYLVSLHDMTECIMANEYRVEASNHRLYELQAVFDAAVLLPEFKNADSWMSDAITDMSVQLTAQFAADGVQNEMDPSYHISALSIFYDINAVAAANDVTSLPVDYYAYLSAAAQFVMDVVYPDYSLENFNDTRSVSWTKSVLKKNFAKYAEMFPDETSFKWMATEHQQGSAPAHLFASYPASGWYMFRSGWEQSDLMLIMKNNWNKDQWWHCQPDNGTIALYNNGRHFLPDAGVYTYGGSTDDNAVRDQFRSTSWHNTMTLDGAVIGDANMLGTFIASSSSDVYDAVCASNQSYPALRHERTVFHVKEGFFVIVDFGYGSATGSAGLHWNLCPGGVTTVQDDISYSCSTKFTDGNNMVFKTYCLSGKEFTTDFTVTSGISYTSTAIGVKEERNCYCVSTQKSSSDTPVGFVTVISPFSIDSPEISVSVNSYTSFEVTVDGKIYSLTLPS